MAGAQAHKTSVGGGFHRPAKFAVVFVTKRNEAEGLENAALSFAYRVQHFGHPLYVAGLRLESDLDEVSFRKRLRQLQQASCGRNHMDVAFSLLAVAEFHQRRGSCKLNSRCTVGGVSLRIVCHANPTMALSLTGREITEAQCTDSRDDHA